MPSKIEVLENEKIIFVKNWGNYSMGDAARQINELVRLSTKKSIYSILVDDIEMETRLSISDLRNLPELYKALKLPLQGTVAIVFSPIRTSRVMTLFLYKEFASKKGYTTKLFTNLESAKAWLKKNK